MNKLFSLAGLAAVVVFVATFLIVSSLTPGYDHLKQPVSDLGKNGAPHAGLMNAVGFGISGVLIVILGLGLWIVFLEKTILTISILLIIAGISWVGIGLFPNYQDKVSVYHVISTYISGGSLATAAILLSREKRAGSWLRNFSLAAGIFLLTRVITGPLFFELETYRGLVQRIYLVVFWLWIICLSILLITRKRPYEND